MVLRKDVSVIALFLGIIITFISLMMYFFVDQSCYLVVLFGIVLSIAGIIDYFQVEKIEKKEDKKKHVKDRRCPKCGKIIPFDSKVCPYCGNKFISGDSDKKEISNSLEILKQRYAKGEITKKEFEEIKKDL
jgi:RNA polymerase subunit RPABC4/transcription elongation factor Spt4